MPSNFNVRQALSPAMAVQALKQPQVLIRVGLGLLFAANLVAAAFAFHLFGDSPAALDAALNSARAQLSSQQQRLTRSRLLTGKVQKGHQDTDAFLSTYLMDRRHTYSTLIGEINHMADQAGMKAKEGTLAPLDPIEGSDDLDMMTVSYNFEGTYVQLVKFVNLIDRSNRFLIIESMTAAPQPKGDLLTVNLKLNAFVREMPNAL